MKHKTLILMIKQQIDSKQFKAHKSEPVYQTTLLHRKSVWQQCLQHPYTHNASRISASSVVSQKAYVGRLCALSCTKSTQHTRSTKEHFLKLRITEYRPKPIQPLLLFATNNTLANTPIDAPKSEIYALHRNPCSSQQRCNADVFPGWCTVSSPLLFSERGFIIVALLIRRYESGLREPSPPLNRCGGCCRKDQRSTSKLFCRGR